MRAVLDTNVIVSAALTPTGKCREIVRLGASRGIELLVSDAILAEYYEVLSDPELRISPEEAKQVVDGLYAAEHVLAPEVPAELPDPDDVMFLQCALGGAADCIVTGNKKHFPAKVCHGVAILSPAEFLERFLRQERRS